MITALRLTPSTRVHPRAAAAPPEPGPRDEVALSPAPSSEASARALGWTALAALGHLSARLVGGPAAVQLDVQQQAFLEDGLKSFQARGGKVLLQRGLLGSLLSLSHPYREVSPAEALEAMGRRQELWVQPRGEAEPTLVKTLDVLAAMEAIALGAPPEQTSAPFKVHSLLKLEAAGYRFAKGALNAYQDERPEVVGPDGRKQQLSDNWLSARAYFELGHDRRTLEFPELAEYLQTQRDLFQEPLDQVYARAHGWGAELSHQGIKLTELRTPSLEAAQQAVAQARAGQAVLEQVFPEAGVLGEQSLAGSIVRSILRCPAEVDPVQAARLLYRTARALPNPVHGYHIGELYEQEVKNGHRGPQLLARLESIALLAHAVSFDDLRDSAEFLQQPGPLPAPAWAGVYAALARPLGGAVARDLMTALRPETDFGLLADLAASQALSGYPANRELLLRDYELLADVEGKPALERARQESALDGRYGLTTARAVATLRGVTPEELDSLALRVQDSRLELPALLAGKLEDESLEETVQRYRALGARLEELNLRDQGPLVFPWLGRHQSQFVQMAELLVSRDRGHQSAWEFIRLRKGCPDFEAALTSYLGSLLVGGDGSPALDPATGAAIAVESGRLRVGGTAIRLKIKPSA